MMKKNETLKWDFHRIYFWLFCFALAVIILACFSGIQFVQGQGCTEHSECALDEKCCNNECINVQTDKNNCGDCEKVCQENEVEISCLSENLVMETKCKKSCTNGRCTTLKTTYELKRCVNGGTCDKKKGCITQEPITQNTGATPQTLTIDIARFVRNTVSFAELGSMAGTWLDKTLGTSFFSTPLWGELEKTWPLGAKFFGGNWESSICRDLWCIIPDDAGISTVGSAIGSHIEGQKLKIGDELNLYKITFALNPATESLTGQMNFTIELYDNSGNKEYIDVNNDKKPDTWININNKYATSKTNPIAFYSEKDYQKICLRFFNTKDYIDELRLLLLSNSNQICTKFFEGDPSDAISEIQTGEIQVGGEVDECANC